MRTNHLLSVRVNNDIVKRLDKLAKVVDRSRSYIALEAIEEYLDLHEWQIKGIKEGLMDIKQGKLLNFDNVKSKWTKK